MKVKNSKRIHALALTPQKNRVIEALREGAKSRKMFDDPKDRPSNDRYKKLKAFRDGWFRSGE
jgi:hypothetical protein